MRWPLRNPLGALSLTRAAVDHGDATVPDAPAAPTATKGTRSALVEWTAPDDGGSAITGYHVEGEARGSASVGVTLSTTVSSLWSGESNRFRVRAVNAVGAGDWSDWSNSVVPYGIPLFTVDTHSVYHASQTTPNEDGAISAIADLGLGSYPWTQSTGGRQPVRGSGRITFDGSDDNLNTTDAAVLALADLSAGGASFAFVGRVDADPAGNRVVGGWGDASSTGVRVEVTTDRSGRVRKHNTAAASSGSMATDASWVAAYPQGTTTGAVLYRDGSASATIAATATLASIVIAAIGAATDGGTSSSTASVIAWMVMGGVMTSDQRAQWDTWGAAGCPMS